MTESIISGGGRQGTRRRELHARGGGVGILNGVIGEGVTEQVTWIGEGSSQEDAMGREEHISAKALRREIPARFGKSKVTMARAQRAGQADSGGQDREEKGEASH